MTEELSSNAKGKELFNKYRYQGGLTRRELLTLFKWLNRRQLRRKRMHLPDPTEDKMLEEVRKALNL